MGLIGGILLSIAGLIAAVIVPVAIKLISDEIKEWLPWLRTRLIERALRILPEDERERYSEEWRSHVNETPGELSKTFVAFGLIVASRAIARELAAPPLQIELPRFGERLARRCVDILVCQVILLTLLPVILIAAILIKMETRGPIAFRLRRIDHNGNEIVIRKLRTMSLGPYRDEGRRLFGFRVQISETDPRVTVVGYYLRRLGIDQTLKLLNVLRGEMTLVGPKPGFRGPPDNDGTIDRRILQAIKPGLMGLGDDEDLTARPEQIEEYARNRSLWRDLKLMFKSLLRFYGW